MKSNNSARRSKVLGMLALPLVALAVAVLLLAGTSSGTKDAEALGPGVGMNLSCPASVSIGGAFNCTISTGTAPAVPIAGWADEILAPTGVSLASISNTNAQCQTEIGGRTQGGGAGPPDSCSRYNAGMVGPTRVTHGIGSAFASPAPAMDGITPGGTGDILVTVGFTCDTAGAHTMVLTYVGAPPKNSLTGGIYAGLNLTHLGSNLIPIKSGDNATVTCSVATPGSVGGISLDPQAGALPLAQPSSSSGSDAGLLAGVIAGTMGIIVLGGGMWYARRRITNL